jgi:MtN3 and saliva related transmembrane protein
MILTDIIGGVAGFLTTVAFVPQVLKVYKSKSAKDLSLSMFIIFCTGVSLWLVYGIKKNDIPIIITNFSTLTLATMLLYFKIIYKN